MENNLKTNQQNLTETKDIEGEEGGNIVNLDNLISENKDNKDKENKSKWTIYK